ncbi:MAG: DUF1292 domain-containing protein [Lachnospirales bacterium]
MDFEELKLEYELIELEDEDGGFDKFFIIDTLVLNEIQYALVIEADEKIDYNDEVYTYIMRINVLEDDYIDMEMLGEGTEYDEISKIFDEQLDEENED